jgi:peptidyl-prolyl cis-trans isomerase SurA
MRARGWRRCLGAAALALLAGLGGAAAQAPDPAQAPDGQKIAVIINDEVVSARDVQRRVDLIIRSSNVQESAELRRRVTQQVVQSLVDERLQLQEAKRRGVGVTDGEIEQALRQIAAANNIAPGDLDRSMAERGMDKDNLVQKLRAEIAWAKLVRGRFQSSVTISDEEVESVIARVRATAGQNESLVSEILISVDSLDQEDEARRNAQRLVEQLRGGGNFAQLARQFSDSATAAIGGDLGWVAPGALPEEVDAVLPGLPVNTISEPIRAAGGFYILAVRERRRIVVADPNDVTLTLKQVVFPVRAGASPGDHDQAMDRAAQVSKSLTGCDAVEAAAKAAGSPESGSLGTLRIMDLPAAFRAQLATLGEGKATAPIRSERGIHVVVVCARQEPAEVKAERERVRQNLAMRRISMMARRYLRDLRRDAMVEMR